MRTKTLKVSEQDYFDGIARDVIKSSERDYDTYSNLAAKNKYFDNEVSYDMTVALLYFLEVYEYIFSNYKGPQLRDAKFEQFLESFTQEQMSKYRLREAQKETKDYFLMQHWPNSPYNKNVRSRVVQRLS